MAKLSDLRVGDIVQVAKMAEGSTRNNSIIGAIGVVVDTSAYAPSWENVVGVNWITPPPGCWIFRQKHPTFDFSFGTPTETCDYEFTILSRSEDDI